ncbi:MAG: hypothetical protein LBO79_10110 [Zoogloeaceae bacterium]|jgi:hypothetical protein|nr:hypothetical protein [Zoogloeaceae bacterium]
MKFFHFLFWLFLSLSAHAVELVETTALGGKIFLLAPSDFQPMSKETLEIKYPMSRRPTEVLSNTAGGIVTLAFNHTNDALQPSQIHAAHSFISQMMHNLYPSAEWFRDEVIVQNGNTFIVMEFVSPAIDTQIHNIIYGTSVDNRFLLIAFNSVVEQAEEWVPIGRKIMSSITVK